MADLKHRLEEILTPQLCLSVYHHQIPYAKHTLPSGAVIGRTVFEADEDRISGLYKLVYHSATLPLSRIPLDQLIAFDLTELLPHPTTPEYPEHCLGMIQILDQSRVFMSGYGRRYQRAFFDPVCEKLARQLIDLPDELRPDGKQAWLSRGYSFEDWLIRVLWFWAPLVHSDVFMTADRQRLKDWLHYMRAEVESHYCVRDPFAPLEAADDVDITLFNELMKTGPLRKSVIDPDENTEATVADYTFWWIRVLNSHIAITDMCGHYPYWVRWRGLEWTDRDREFMEKNGSFRHKPADDIILEQVRKDYLKGVWQPLELNLDFGKKIRGGEVVES